MKTDRVYLLLAALLLAGAALPLLSYAPNRLLSGQGLWLSQLHSNGVALLLLPALPLLASPWLPDGRRLRLGMLLAAATLSNALLWLAGHEAALRAGGEDSLVRVSFAAGFWLQQLAAWLLLIEALRRLSPGVARQTAAVLAALLPAAWLLYHGTLDQLSLLKEYDNYRDNFAQALLQHVQLVLFSLLPALLAGTLLGLLAFRSARVRGWLFPLLNVVQTIPSIALFGLLIGPLALLGRLFPHSGIAGVGMPPALLALLLYSLLPLTRGTLAGLQQVPPAVREAARGMGMSPWQVFWRVELPLALPVFVGGVRITAVQAVGLAEVAALIGAGGLGAIMFQGLSGSALDLVLLGVLPVVALAIAVDTLFKLLISWLDRLKP